MVTSLMDLGANAVIVQSYALFVTHTLIWIMRIVYTLAMHTLITYHTWNQLIAIVV